MTDQPRLNLKEGEFFAFEKMPVDEVGERVKRILKEARFVHHFAESLAYIIEEGLAAPDGVQHLSREFAYDFILTGFSLNRIMEILQELLEVKREGGES